MGDLSELLLTGNRALEQQDIAAACTAYKLILTSKPTTPEEKEIHAKAHLGLAKVAFLNKECEEGQKHLLEATRGQKDYSFYDAATELCKIYIPSFLPELLHDALYSFPVHLKPFIELWSYYQQSDETFPLQRELLSRMANNVSMNRLSPDEKRHFRKITNYLAKDYFSRAHKTEKDNSDPVTRALDQWLWGFEVEGWIKTEPPFQPVLILSSYGAPNTKVGQYQIEPMGMTQIGHNRYSFEYKDMIIIPVTTKSLAEVQFYTHGETIEDYVEDAIDVYYNDHFINAHGQQLQQLIIENRGTVTEDKWRNFLKEITQPREREN